MNIDLTLTLTLYSHYRFIVTPLKYAPKGRRKGVPFNKKVISSTLAMHPSSSLERLPAAEDFVRHCNALWNGRVEGTGGVDRGTLQHPLCTSVTSGRMKKATSHPKFIELSSP